MFINSSLKIICLTYIFFIINFISILINKKYHYFLSFNFILKGSIKTFITGLAYINEPFINT